MFVTSNGRPVGRFPLFKFRDGHRFLLRLERVDISDIRNQPVAHAFYTHAVAIEKRDGMTTVEFTGTRRWIIFLAPKRITFYVDPKPNEHDDQV